MKGEYILNRKTIKENLVSDLKVKEIILEWRNDNSGSESISQIINREYSDVWRVSYGRSRIRFDNENSTAVETITLPFGATPIINNNILNDLLLSYPTSAINTYSPQSAPKALFLNKVDCNFPIGYNIDPKTGSSTQFLNLGYYHTATHWNDPNNPTEDLNFGISREYYYIPNAEFTENNLVNKFWRGTIKEIDSSKLITIEMWMSDSAISTLKMNTKFYLEILGQTGYFIINKLIQWDGVTNKATLELITYEENPDFSKRKNISTGKPVGNSGRTELKERDNYNLGDYTIVGRDNSVEGNKGSVIGDRNTISGDFNNVKGTDNSVVGGYNELTGVRNVSTGDFNTINGGSNFNEGNFNNITGDRNIISGDRIIVRGNDLVATESDSQYFTDYKVNSSGVIENPLTIRVNTQLTGDTSDNQFALSYDTGGTILVKWGDGSEDFTNGVLTHTYLNPGIYNIEITAVPTVNEYIFTVDRTKIIGIFSIGNLGWTDSIEVFSGCSNIARIVLNDGRFLSNSLRTGEMFAGIISTPNIDVSSFDTSSLTGAVEMFRDGGWETINISGWNTSNLTLMNGMFRDCPNLTEVIGLSSFDISSVIDMTDIFTGTTLSSTNYEEIWAGWTLSTPQTGVTFSGGGMTLSVGSPGDIVRDDFITNYSWIVIDGDNP